MNFRFKRFTIRQDRTPMKVGTDGCLLGAWAAIPSGGTRLLDIGTGTGVIALMLAQRFPQADITAIDILPDAVAEATTNANASPFADRLTVRGADIRNFSGGLYDTIVCNPPFFSASLSCPDGGRTLARHDTSLTFDGLTSSVARLLAPDGLFSLIIPADRQRNIEDAAAAYDMRPVRICYIKTTATKPPKRLLIEFRKHSHLPVQSEYITIGDEAFTRLLNDFYLNL